MFSEKLTPDGWAKSGLHLSLSRAPSSSIFTVLSCMRRA
jgi:hypothetical protein